MTKRKRIAVAGMGRSGVGIAIAAKNLDWEPVVFDEQSADTPERIETVEKLESEGIECVTGWHGRLKGENFEMLVASPGFKRTHPSIRDALEGGIEVISEVEFAWRIAKAPIIGITGTNGKSTTTVMTWHLLRAAGQDALLCGNISGSGYTELTLTEAAFQARSDQVLVAEISSYQLEWTHQFRPRVATITNLTPDHLDRHPNTDDYYRTKFRIFEKQSSGDVAVINVDEPTADESIIAPHLSPEVTLLKFGLSPRRELTSWLEKDRIWLDGRSVPTDELPFFGSHNITNALQALTCACGLMRERTDDQVEAMLESLRSFKGLAHRMETVGEKSGVLIINNSMCTNPGAVIASSRALKRPQVVMMGGSMKNLCFEPVGQFLREVGHRVILFGPHRQELGEQIAVPHQGFETLEEAFIEASKVAVSGDAILFSPGCASAFPHANFRERGDAFKEMALRWLKS